MLGEQKPMTQKFLILIASLCVCIYNQFELVLQPCEASGILPISSASNSQTQSAIPMLRVQRLADSIFEVSVDCPSKIEYPPPIRAFFSNSGEHLALQLNHEAFVVVSCQSIMQGSETVSCGRLYSGRIIGFLHSEQLLYLTRKDLRKLNIGACKDSAVLSFSESSVGPDYFDEHLIASDALVLSGGGDPDIGYPGRIIRYDLTKKQVVPCVKVAGFRNAVLSPSGPYITYEFGNEEYNEVHIYDVEKNKDHALKEFIALGPNSSQTAMGWVGKDRLLLWLTSKKSDNMDSMRVRLALLDLGAHRVVWQREPKVFLLPTDIHPINKTKVLANNSDTQRMYEIELTNGAMQPNRYIRGCSIAVSPNKRWLATVQLNDCENAKDVVARVFVSKLDGQDIRQIAQLPSWEFQRAYKGMGIISPIWSPRGDVLVILGEQKLAIIKLPNPREAMGK